MLLQSFGFEANFEGVFIHTTKSSPIFLLKKRPIIQFNIRVGLPGVTEMSEKNKIFSGSGKSRGI